MPTDHDLVRRWPRLLGEMIMVAVGVFLGLAADAAWDVGQERRLERSYIASLAEEMRGAKEELALDDELRALRVTSLESLQAEFEARRAPDSLVGEWLDGTRGTSAFFPPTAVLDDLVSTGNLQLISSDDLRSALMSYAQERPRLRYTEDIEHGFWASNFRPYLIEHLSLTSSAPSAATIDSLLTSRTFENLVATRLNQVRGSVRRAGDMSHAIERVIELLAVP